MGLSYWLVKVTWLVELASVFWWVELELFSLECNEVSSNEGFLGVYGFVVTLGSLYFNIMAIFLHCWRISIICLGLELVGSWVELGFNVGTQAFG